MDAAGVVEMTSRHPAMCSQRQAAEAAEAAELKAVNSIAFN